MHVFPSRNLMIICPTLNRFPDIFAFFLKPENPNLHLGLVLGGKGTRPYHFSTPSGADCVTVPLRNPLTGSGSTLLRRGHCSSRVGLESETGHWLNNRAENSHLPLRRRARAMLCFRRMRSLQKFVAVHSWGHLTKREKSYAKSHPNGRSWPTTALFPALSCSVQLRHTLT